MFSAANRQLFFMGKRNFTAYILAGGKSHRMGSDKLFLKLGSQSMLEHAIAACDECFKQVKLVAGKRSRFLALNHNVVLDSPRAQGPMAGVIAALEDCETDICFVTAADLPDLTAEIIRSLVSHYRDQQYLGLIEKNGLQPLCGIYHKSSLDVFYHCAQNDKFCMAEALKSLDHSGIALPAGRWRNINCPEDLVVGDPND